MSWIFNMIPKIHDTVPLSNSSSFTMWLRLWRVFSSYVRSFNHQAAQVHANRFFVLFVPCVSEVHLKCTYLLHNYLLSTGRHLGMKRNKQTNQFSTVSASFVAEKAIYNAVTSLTSFAFYRCSLKHCETNTNSTTNTAPMSTKNCSQGLIT